MGLKYFKYLLCCVCVGLLCIMPCQVQASEIEEEVLFDYAELLTEEEEVELREKIINTREKLQWDDIFVVTADDVPYEGYMAYADDFYDERTEWTSSGVCLLLDMNNRMIWLSTAGHAIRVMNDDLIEDVTSVGVHNMKNEEYAKAVSTMLYKLVDKAAEGERRLRDDWIFFGILEIGVVVLAGVIARSTASSVYKEYSVKSAAYEYEYKKYSQLDLKENQDKHTDTRKTVAKITTSSGGHSGGSSRSSSTHRSSSGRSHGGGGSRF